MKNFLFFLILVNTTLFAQNRTVGLITNSDNVAAGYTLFAPTESQTTYLIDNDGYLIHTWESTSNPGLSVYLLEDGTLLRAEMARNSKFNGGGTGGRVKMISWDGATTWQYDYSSTNYCHHHDIEYLPNGNVLMIAWELKSQSEALAAGRRSAGMMQSEVWPDHIIEVKPVGSTGGEIVWEWHAWDHMIQDYSASRDNYGVVAEHPELIDINFTQSGESGGGSSDWLHVNAVDYNAELDQIMLSVRHFSEVWIIDHSTSTEEAAGHTGGRYGKGGDLLYRFGNPQAYDNGSGSNEVLYLQHDAHWIPEGYPNAGNVLVFNNGGSSRSYSSVDEFSLPVDESGIYSSNGNGAFVTPTIVWSYTANNFYANNVSGSQRMKNGNTLICNGPNGTFFEVDSEKNIEWEYISPVTGSGVMSQYDNVGGGRQTKNNNVFRCTRYTPDYAAFDGKDLTPGSPIEHYTSVDFNEVTLMSYSLGIYPNPFNPSTKINFSIPQNSNISLKIFNASGQEIMTVVNEYLCAGKYEFEWNGSGNSSGVYLVRLTTNNYSMVEKILLLK